MNCLIFSLLLCIKTVILVFFSIMTRTSAIFGRPESLPDFFLIGVPAFIYILLAIPLCIDTLNWISATLTLSFLAYHFCIEWREEKGRDSRYPAPGWTAFVLVSPNVFRHS